MLICHKLCLWSVLAVGAVRLVQRCLPHSYDPSRNHINRIAYPRSLPITVGCAYNSYAWSISSDYAVPVKHFNFFVLCDSCSSCAALLRSTVPKTDRSRGRVTTDGKRANSTEPTARQGLVCRQLSDYKDQVNILTSETFNTAEGGGDNNGGGITRNLCEHIVKLLEQTDTRRQG